MDIQNFKGLLLRHKIMIISLLTVGIITIIFLLSYRSQTDKEPTVSSMLLQPTSTPAIIKPPQVKFAKWINQAASIPNEPIKNIYTFQTSFTPEYITNFAQTLGVKGDQVTKQNNVFITDNTNSFIVFDKTTGTFTYYAKNGLSLSNGETLSDNIYIFLQSIGIYDSTMKITATYKKQKQDTITYYELHRDWSLVGLPILNKFGLTNLPENIKLNELSLSQKLTSDEVNPTIYATSDNRDGYNRNDDFNTLTIAVDKNNKVISITSHLRPLDKALLSVTNLKTYEEAVGDLQAQKVDSIITAPSGQGYTDWQKVYPQNLAEAEEAVVTDAVLAYSELPLAHSQSTLEPHYIFRGYATIKSGYRINFIATVKGTKKTFGLNNLWHLITKDVYAQDEFQRGSQHQGTFFSVTPTPTVTPRPQSIPPTATSVPQAPQVCAPSLAQIQPLQDWDGIQVGYFEGVTYSIPGGYYMVGNTFTVEHQLQDWINKALERHEDGSFNPEEGGIRELIDIMREIYLTPDCPVRLTGPSPSLFIYGLPNINYHIIPSFTLTYADPPLAINTGWNINFTDTMKINNSVRNYIYYEYQPVSFMKPLTGWLIKKNEIKSLIEDISNKLKLTQLEKDRLDFELHNASTDIKENELYVGLLEEEIINTRISLTIEPSIPLNRYHFYLASHPPTNFTHPLLKPIQRTKELAIEFGAVTGD